MKQNVVEMIVVEVYWYIGIRMPISTLLQCAVGCD